MNDLLESGAPLNGKGALCTSRATEESRDAYDKSRVQVAAKEGRKAMVGLLLLKGADKDGLDTHYLTPLLWRHITAKRLLWLRSCRPVQMPILILGTAPTRR